METRKERRPELIGWEITSWCNLSCPHCYSSAASRPRDEMSTDECRGIIDQLAELGLTTIGWTGGEPLLRDDLEDLTEYALTKRIRCNITTNGILLTRERAQRLLDAGNRAFQISLDGSTPERNRRMRGTTDDEFWKILDAVRTCRSINARVNIATLIGRENLDDGPRMIKLAEQEGVDAIRFCGYTPKGRGRRGDIKARFGCAENTDELLRFVEYAQAQTSIVVSFDAAYGPVPPAYDFHKCVAGIETFYLKGNGDVYPCTALLHPRFRVGNARRHSLQEIWNRPEMTAMAALPRDTIEGPCRGCDNFDNCHGACRGATFTHTGELQASFPVCLYRTAVGAALPAE